jgi:hypothetical protein
MLFLVCVANRKYMRYVLLLYLELLVLLNENQSEMEKKSMSFSVPSQASVYCRMKCEFTDIHFFVINRSGITVDKQVVSLLFFFYRYVTLLGLILCVYVTGTSVSRSNVDW